MKYPEVFLAGICGKSTWRQDIAIPLLEAAGITYYNPQYPEGTWHEGLMAVEREAKRYAHWIIDVIGGETRGTASIMEATELVCTGKQVVLVIEDVQDGTVVFDVPVTGRDLEDTNRCRAYLREMISQRQISDVQRYPDAFVVSSVEEATQLAIAHIESYRGWGGGK
jgi:raw